MSADPHEVVHKAKLLKGFCDAANITDCQTACAHLIDCGGGPSHSRTARTVMQMTCRDRNRIAMQADCSAAALDSRTVCLAATTRSSAQRASSKATRAPKNVYDLDTCQLVGMLKKMRDESKQEGGDPLEVAPKFSIGFLDAHGRIPSISGDQPHEEGERGAISSRPGHLRHVALRKQMERSGTWGSRKNGYFSRASLFRKVQ